MFRFTYGDINESIVTVNGTIYLLLELEQNVKEMKGDLKEIKDDGKELKQEVRDLRGEVNHELKGIKDNLQAVAASEPGKWLRQFLLLMLITG